MRANPLRFLYEMQKQHLKQIGCVDFNKWIKKAKVQFDRSPIHAKF